MQDSSCDRILRLSDVVQITNLSPSTIQRRCKDGTFPQKLRLSPRCVGWRASAIEKWLEERGPSLPETGMGGEQ